MGRGALLQISSDPGLLADPHPDFSPRVSVLEFSPPIPDLTLTIYRYHPDLVYLK
jgi:hypothetical protein